jgi:DNA-binding LytR/AlgR family response regulator
MIRIALCDDEQKILDETSLQIKKYEEERKTDVLEIACFNSSNALLSALEDDLSFDIFILDVYISDGLGTELARTIRKKGIEAPIIFLTTSVKHAPESFESDTLRYLIKPLNPEKFYEAMDVAVEKAEKLGTKLIRLKTENGIENINISNILYTESRSHYQYVNFTDSDQVRSRMTVSELFEELSQHGGFVRAGSAYIINLNKVKSVSTGEVCFNNNTKLLLPRGAHNEIKEAFWLLQYDGQEG